MAWRIYYADGSVVNGAIRNDWRKAPQEGIQAVVSFPREQQPRRWHYQDAQGKFRIVEDRDLWTGENTYDLNGWGAKLGSLLADEVYFEIWNRACGDSNP